MAAPTYFGSASNPADNGTAVEPATLAVTPPASMVAGDLVIMHGWYDESFGTGDVTLSEQGGQTWNGPLPILNAMTGRTWWCEFSGTWSADPSIAFAAQTGTRAVSVVMHVFRKPAGETAAWQGPGTLAGASYAAPSTPFTVTRAGITPTLNQNIVLAYFFSQDDNTWDSLTGAGWVLTGAAQYRNLGGGDMSGTFAHQLQDTAAATGDVSKNQATLGGDAGVTGIASWACPAAVSYFPPFPQPVYITRS